MFGKTRIEIFSDGVMAIIITIMVLDIKAPLSNDLSALLSLYPKFLSYLLSFAYIAIYWNNHHHMFTLVDKINGQIMWSNFNLLFWLSLIPFTTSWVGETIFSKIPVIIYGAVLLLTAVAYRLLERRIIRFQGSDSKLKKAVGADYKERLSIAIYTVGIICGFISPLISMLAYVSVALLWIMPDRRIESI